MWFSIKSNRDGLVVVYLVAVQQESLAGESLANHPGFAKPKPSKLVLAIKNVVVHLLIHQTFLPNAQKQ